MQREHHHDLTDVLARGEFDMLHRIWINRREPSDWDRIEERMGENRARWE